MIRHGKKVTKGEITRAKRLQAEINRQKAQEKADKEKRELDLKHRQSLLKKRQIEDATKLVEARKKRVRSILGGGKSHGSKKSSGTFKTHGGW